MTIDMLGPPVTRLFPRERGARPTRLQARCRSHTLRKRKVLVHGAVVGAVRATLGAQVELRALVFDVRLGPVTTSIGSVQARHARRLRAQLCLRVRAVPDGAEAA